VALVCGPRGEEALLQALRLLATYSREIEGGRHARWRDEGGREQVRALQVEARGGKDGTATGGGPRMAVNPR
jgi:hypothetical protein